MNKQVELYAQLFGFDKDLREFNDKMILLGQMSADYDVPIGFGMTTDGDFYVKFSLSTVSNVKRKTFYEVMNYILEFKTPSKS